MTNSDFHDTMLCMERYGGTFMTKMADALRYADPMNRERILFAFPEIAETYGPTSPFQPTKHNLITA